MYSSIIPLDKANWICDICGKDVAVETVEYEENKFSLIPASRYWHGIKKVAYCSPECSHKAHFIGEDDV